MKGDYIKDILAKQSQATPRNVLFIAFGKHVCQELKKYMPEYRVYWLVGAKRGRKGPAIPAAEVVATLKKLGVDGVDQKFEPDVVTADYIAEIRAAGFEYHSWTIETLNTACLAFERGAQTVTTNCAKKLLEEYGATR